MSIPASQEILRSVKNKEYKPIYFLSGEEPYFIDIISNYIEDSVLDESEKAFNQTIVYGRDVKFEELEETLKRFPMMSDYQVVIIKEAQNIRQLKEKLSGYLEHAVESTILVVCFKYKKTSDKKFIKLIQSKGVYFESKPLRADKIPAWINGYANRKKLTINDKSSYLLHEYLGSELSKIANEIDKLSIVLPEGGQITDDVIEANIGISKDFNTFELVNALSSKNVKKANRIVYHFAANKKSHPLVVTIGTLFSYFSKVLAYHYLQDKSKGNTAKELRVPPFFLNDYINGAKNYKPVKLVEIIDDIRITDTRSKGIGNSSTDEGELLKELIFRILH